LICGGRDGDGGGAAHDEALVFLVCFAEFPDRRQRGKVIYPLDEVLLLCLLEVFAGAETFVVTGRRRTTTSAIFSRHVADHKRTRICFNPRHADRRSSG
jgi:hypothetical protein